MNNSVGITKSFIGFFRNLEKIRKIQFLLVLFSNTLSGFCEFLIVGSVGIFITSITEPQLLNGSNQAQFLKKFINPNQSDNLVSLILILFISIVLISNIIRLLNLWIIHKFNVNYFSDLSKKAFRKVLSQDFSYHLKNNSSQLISNLTFNMNQTSNFVIQFLVFFNYIISSLSIFFALILINFKLTVLIIIIIGSTYIVLTTYLYRKIENYGKIIVNSDKIVVKSIQEGLGSIKDTILADSQNFYLSRFSTSVLKVRTYQGLVNLYAQSPKFIIEGIGLILISIIGYRFSLDSDKINAISFLGSFALGAQKLLPSVQNVYSGWTNLLAYSKGFEKILFLLNLPENRKILEPNLKPYNFAKDIVFKDLSFKFESSRTYNLNKINLKIKKGEKIGLIGKTGSGKTTLINVLMGLLKPQSGYLIIDDIKIFDKDKFENLVGWRKGLAHVPQKIYLSDNTILENIAFSKSKNDIDLNRVILAAEKACILDYINQTQNKFDTVVGEQGIRMSGGQLQRLGIARAIYLNKNFMILDEATSALDIATEKKVMENISKISSEMTLIITAHRLSTLYFCDRIIEFENGNIKRIITGEDLRKEVNQKK